MQSLDFNLPGRQLKVLHTNASDQILAALQPLNRGGALKDTAPAPAPAAAALADELQASQVLGLVYAVFDFMRDGGPSTPWRC